MRISLSEAQQRLNTGQVVALPTETVYGLGALLKFPEAIDSIFTLKGRPTDNPLIIHVASLKEILEYVEEIPDALDDLAATFWPGPMTLVMKIKPNTIPEKARAGLPTAAFRIPHQLQTLEILASCGAIVMPSANLSGKPSSTLPEHVEEDFGISFPIVDGGSCQNGVESTILIYQGIRWEIIRLGALPPEAFQPVLGYVPLVKESKKGETPLCPGQSYRHYAPKAKLTLCKEFTPDGSGVVLGFEDVVYATGYNVISLGPLTQPHIVAENLYSILRQLDEKEIPCALVDMRFPTEGLWLTIDERLKRASLGLVKQ